MDEALEVPVMITGLITLFIVTSLMGIAAARRNRD